MHQKVTHSGIRKSSTQLINSVDHLKSLSSQVINSNKLKKLNYEQNQTQKRKKQSE